MPDLAMPDLNMPDLAHLPYPFGGPCTSGADCSSGMCLPSGVCGKACSAVSDCPGPDWSCSGSCMCTPSGPEVCDGHDNDCNGLVDDVLAPNSARYVLDQIFMPTVVHQYGIDLNGDGKVDNALFNILNGVKALAPFDPQTSVNMSIANGSMLYLLDERSADTTFTSDACAGVVMRRAQQTTPKFDGTDTFMIDTTEAAANLYGAITASQFGSAPVPVATTIPVHMKLLLPILPGGLGMPLVGVQVQFTRDQGKLRLGALQGAILRTDLEKILIPQLAGLGTALSPAFFDDGGKPSAACGATCQNPDGTCAVAGDSIDDICEVSTNTLVTSLLQPDVQLFDAQGNFHPNPANTKPDCVSVGLGFTAVPAVFTPSGP